MVTSVYKVNAYWWFLNYFLIYKNLNVIMYFMFELLLIYKNVSVSVYFKIILWVVFYEW